MIVVVFAGFFTFSIESVNYARLGCKRLDTLRQTQYEYLVRDLKQRESLVQEDKQSLEILEAPNPVDAIRRAYGITLSPETLEVSVQQAHARIKLQERVIKNDRIGIENIKQSTKPFDDPPGSTTVNCEKAYPYPFPLN
jgi:hypothetical protein